MFFDTWGAMLRVVVVSACAYAALVTILRWAGKRSLAKLNAFDLVVTVALGSTLATVLLSKDVALAEGVLAMAMLLVLQWIVSKASLASANFGGLVRSEPRLLFERGCYGEAAMADERILKAEVDAAIRRRGCGSLDEVAAVVLETDGSLSVIKGSGDTATLTALSSVRR